MPWAEVKFPCQKRDYLRTKGGSDCYNPYGRSGPPPPEQTPGEPYQPLGDSENPTDPDFDAYVHNLFYENDDWFPW